MNLKLGSVVKFKDNKDSNGNYNNGWNPAMDYLYGQIRIITQDIINQITKPNKKIWEDELWIEYDSSGSQWYISQDMIESVS